MKSIKFIENLKNKKVLVRVDFNVPVGDDGVVDEKEDWRIKAVLPTIEYLLKKEARIILISHLGRPGQYKVSSIKYQICSLRPVANRLGELLNCKIKFIDDCVGNEAKKEAEKMKAGEIVLLENLRFYKEEKSNDKRFAGKLANLADIYINDAFSVSHRAHASVSAITEFLPSYAGLLLEKEVKILSEATNNPERPATVIVGGAKAETKLPMIKNLMNKFDFVLAGGIVANVILKAKGLDIGKSVLDKNIVKDAKEINLTNNRLHIPIDLAVCSQDNSDFNIVAAGRVGKNNIIYDIGPETASLFLDVIKNSKTIIWNGPVGFFEKENFDKGTKKIAEAVANSKAYTIIGGGDTIAAFDKFGYLDNLDYICTGGGAMLEFLSGNKLPGLEALE